MMPAAPPTEGPSAAARSAARQLSNCRGLSIDSYVCLVDLRDHCNFACKTSHKSRFLQQRALPHSHQLRQSEPQDSQWHTTDIGLIIEGRFYHTPVCLASQPCPTALLHSQHHCSDAVHASEIGMERCYTRQPNSGLRAIETDKVRFGVACRLTRVMPRSQHSARHAPGPALTMDEGFLGRRRRRRRRPQLLGKARRQPLQLRASELDIRAEHQN